MSKLLVKSTSFSISNILINFLVFGLSFSVNAEALKIGLVDYPPHLDFKTPLEESKLFQYTDGVFKKQGLKAEFIKYPYRRALLELKKGNIDLLLPYDYSDKSLKILSKPIFYSVPGLCFKKEKFIPILSALHRLKGLKIGIPPGVPIVSVLQNAEANLVDMQGSDITNRGIALTQLGRIDAFYHPSPLKVYHSGDERYKEVACSYFHGYDSGVYIATSPRMSEKTFTLIDGVFKQALNELSYEYYFAR